MLPSYLVAVEAINVSLCHLSIQKNAIIFNSRIFLWGVNEVSTDNFFNFAVYIE